MPVRFLPYSLGTLELASPSTSPPYSPHSDLNRSQKISFIHCAQGVSRGARTESSREESRDEQAVRTEAYLPFRRYLPVSFQLRVFLVPSRVADETRWLVRLSESARVAKRVYQGIACRLSFSPDRWHHAGSKVDPRSGVERDRTNANDERGRWRNERHRDVGRSSTIR